MVGMMRQTIRILRALTDPRVARVPLRMLRQARFRDSRHAGDPTQRRSENGGWRRRLEAIAFLWRWLRSERLTRHRGQWVINSFLPPFPGRGFDRIFENLLPGDSFRPHSAFLSLTSDCPADCSYCSAKNRRAGRQFDRAEWLDVIEQVHRLRPSLIGLTGGEPLVREDLRDLVRAAYEGGAEVVLFTSGLGATQARLDTLRNAGLWAVGVSLDHTRPDVVNRTCRTPGAFDAARAALEMSRRAGLYTFISAVPDRRAVLAGEHRRLYGLARRLGIDELRLTEPMPCGRLALDGHERLLGPRQVAELRRFHREMNHHAQGPKVCASNQVESPEFIGCVAGTFHLYVDASGEVCPCDFTPLSFGSVREESLEVIWRRMTRAMHLPRRRCFIQANAALIRRHAEGHEFPLLQEVSRRIAAETPQEPLPDYFRLVSRPFECPY